MQILLQFGLFHRDLQMMDLVFIMDVQIQMQIIMIQQQTQIMALVLFLVVQMMEHNHGQ